MVRSRLIQRAEIGAVKTGLRDQRHVVRCRDMVCVVQAVRIHEMRVGAAELSGSPVHLLRERGDRARDMLGESVCDLVRGFQHEPVETIPHLDTVALREFQIHRARLQISGRAVGEHNHVILRTVLEHQKCRHKLGDRSRIELLIRVLLIQKLSRRRIVERRALRGNLRRSRRISCLRTENAAEKQQCRDETTEPFFDFFLHQNEIPLP